MKSYSVAIRTLGLSPEILKKELESLHRQTVAPQSIDIYIANGYAIPEFRVGMEKYHSVPKGMVAQRALPYENVSSDCILLLDDDVELTADSVERLLNILEESSADCVAADTFETHNMSLRSKIRAAVANFSFPRFNNKWAVTVRSDDSFSYINNPKKPYYPTQSAAGPASLWTMEAFRRMNFQDELWLDSLGFAYGDDGLEFFKLHVNGGKLLMAYNVGFVNLNARTSSSAFHRSGERFCIMAKSNITRWHRMHYSYKSPGGKIIAATMFTFKQIWQLGILTVLSLNKSMRSAPKMFVKGIREGLEYLKNEEYKSLPPYKR